MLCTQHRTGLQCWVYNISDSGSSVARTYESFAYKVVIQEPGAGVSS
jgi:hypothetical protein